MADDKSKSSGSVKISSTVEEGTQNKFLQFFPKWIVAKLKTTKSQETEETASNKPARSQSQDHLVKCPEIDFTNLFDEKFAPPKYRVQYTKSEKGKIGERKLNRASSWQEFTKSTTFHGLKYIFDNRPYKIRRLLWFFTVLVCTGLFSYQVIDRSLTFIRSESNVNVEVMYVDDMQFPAVTICNQNSYRITATVDRGLHSFIDKLFSNDNMGREPSITPYACSYNNLTEFTLETAHQKQDFIDSCTWRGRKCDIDKDFQTTLTDFGVCYIFNGGENQRHVYKSGSGFALRLILNVEQYEYMKGPQDEAGIKVLLHDPAELPQVKDLGFAVAPGTHSLVAVHRQEVESLEKPHGHCVKGSQPRSHCQAKCQAAEVFRVCGCVDVYMPKDKKVCDMSSAFTCARRVLASLTEEETTCVCDVPCDRVVYKPELSYAHLSQLSVDRISLNDSDKRTSVYEKYARALEIRARVNPNIAKKDIKMFTSILNWFSRYKDDITESFKVLQNETHLIRQYGVSDITQQAYSMMTNDFPYIRNDYMNKGYRASFKHPRTHQFTSMIYRLELFLEVMNGISPFEIRLEICAKEEDEDQKHLTTRPKTVIASTQYRLNECEDSEGSDTYLLYKRMAANDISKDAVISMRNINGMMPEWESTLDYIFGNTTVDVKKESSYNECLRILTNHTETWYPFVESIKNLTKAYSNASTTWKEKYGIYLALINFPNLTHTNSSLANAANFLPCNWFVLDGFSAITSGKNYGLFLAHMEAAEKAFLDARSIIPPLQTMSEQLSEELTSKGHLLFHVIDLFLNSNNTKMDTYRHFHSQFFKVEMEQVKLMQEQYMADFQQFINKLADLENNMVQSYHYAFNLPVPMLNDSVISNLELTKFAYQRVDVNADHRLYLDMIQTDREAALRGLIKVIFGFYRNAMKNVQMKILQSFNEVQVAVVAAQVELKEYANSHELNEDFFMENYIKVDIFFKELSYELVKQHVSFEFLSLISEIGGFMGLLLGASVLTVCELIDYMVVVALRRCKAKSHVKKANGKY